MQPLTKSSARTEAPTDFNPNLAGQTFGDFRLLRKLGQGGMGQVYLAEQVSLKRKVAVKMLREEVAANSTALARFQSESKTIAKLSHANVVQAYTVGEHDGRHYLALEYVEGVSLREYMARKGPLDVPLVLSIMKQVANALHRAAEMDIVHRDIKPENILLTRKGEAKVADFGLSLCLTHEDRVDLTREGSTVGTPLYMSPEQIEGKEIDCRSDIYSFGVTCYHMLTGHVPFDGSNAYAVAAKHMHEEAKPLEKIRPDLPRALCDLIRKMMAKKPGERYASPRELLNEVSRVRKSLGTANTELAIVADTPVDDDAPEIQKPRMKAKPASRQPMVLALGGVAVVGVLALVAVAAVLGLGAAFAWKKRSQPQAEPTVLAPVPVVNEEVPAVRPDATEALRLAVEQHLKEFPGKPAGVDACIDLAVLYLEQNKTQEAEALFRRMTERKPPSSYYFVGRLGLAVTDAANNNDKASHAKFKELFDGKSKDNRVQVLNDYLTRSPDFAAWVNEADTHNVRKGGGVDLGGFPKTFRRPTTPMSKFLFKK